MLAVRVGMRGIALFPHLIGNERKSKRGEEALFYNISRIWGIAMQKIEVQSRSLHSSQAEDALPTIALDLLNEEITVAELIQRTIEEQVRELLAASKLEAEQAVRALERHYLTEEEIRLQATEGVVRLADPKGSDASPYMIDCAAAVNKAFRAFEKRAYLVIVDGKIAQRLDEQLTFRPGCKVSFVRLTPLKGG